MTLRRDHARRLVFANGMARCILGGVAMLRPEIPLAPWVGDAAKDRSTRAGRPTCGPRRRPAGRVDRLPGLAGLRLIEGAVKGAAEGGVSRLSEQSSGPHLTRNGPVASQKPPVRRAA